MPHLTLEYSANLLEKKSFSTLFDKCHQLLAEKLPTERKSCVSKAYECHQYYIGEGAQQNAFVHVTVKVKGGRTTEVLEKTGDALLAMIKEYLKTSFDQLNLKVSVEIVELQKTYFS